MAVAGGLKKQIKSIKSISKITKAMELVSTAKLKKSAKIITNSKPYFSEMYTIFNDIISSADDSIYQLKKNQKINSTTWVIINSNLGLCGGYNLNLNKMVAPLIKQNDSIILFGTKSSSFYKNKTFEPIKIVKDFDINFSFDDARIYAVELLSKFNNKEIESIKIAYTKYINNVTFEPVIIDLLPIEKKQSSKNKNHVLTEFDPTPEKVLDTSVPIYINTIIYSAVIESQVSEQASRRMAMENATSNAEEMIEKLSLEYNRKRQASITQEISEIVAGANAQK